MYFYIKTKSQTYPKFTNTHHNVITFEEIFFVKKNGEYNFNIEKY